ncbi:molybdenum cofactor cytidylyltransferase [Arthrobacter sp. MYb227]|uniref:nucleotidyltransferase family protein n=1 Tax=Arthrobacter sp. MYb227 TaxID=1848601 RepID=UPI000CFCE170|nr:nucleotidyltransferase family protein [Arthrobacter sp. MYb227]PQZ95009.1 molybdenum cofactor cytidylyltransferase [Arthrobacter sp. MYb227]
MPSTSAQVTGVLLAAGSGSRLGLGPKALLRKKNGETLLATALFALLAGGCHHVVVVLGAGAEQVSAQLEKDERITVLINAAWSSGMGSSFALGMSKTPAKSPVLVALVDQPGLNPELVQRLVQAHRDGRITAAGYRRAGTQLGRGHPVLFAPEHRGPAASAASRDAGARAYLAAHEDLIDLLDCSDLDSGLDIDTIDDLHLLGIK